MAKNQYKKEPLKNNVEEMFIGPFGSSLKNECFVDEEDAYCMVYEQKHAIQKTLDGKNRFVDKNKYYELKRFTIKPGDIIELPGYYRRNLYSARKRSIRHYAPLHYENSIKTKRI